MKIEEMISQNRAECFGCAACANICPKKAISMQRDAEGFEYPKIDHAVCVQCGKCDGVCPSLNLPKKISAPPTAFVAINPDAKVRRHSSSGGIFGALAKVILDEGGIVFGAAFDENFSVAHMAAENFSELEKLHGSKYLQSQIGKTFQQVKKHLAAGRKVLFSGTGCQCAGLKNFVGDSENLLIVEIFCHGVPSPALWESYIKWLGRGHEIVRVNFKSKRGGWQNPHFEVTFKDCGFYFRPLNEDTFNRNFLQNTIQRPSCGICKFRLPSLQSDLMIGDAWGVQNFAPDFFDNLGISVIILHTERALKILQQTNLVGRAVNFNAVLQGNPVLVIPTPEDPRRESFFADLKNSGKPINVLQKFAN